MDYTTRYEKHELNRVAFIFNEYETLVFVLLYVHSLCKLQIFCCDIVAFEKKHGFLNALLVVKPVNLSLFFFFYSVSEMNNWAWIARVPKMALGDLEANIVLPLYRVTLELITRHRMTGDFGTRSHLNHHKDVNIIK